MNAPVKLAALTYASMGELIPKMSKGQQMVYHVGSLMYDRLRGPQFQTTHGVALAAWEAYERGEVTLVQRRQESFIFTYILIRR